MLQVPVSRTHVRLSVLMRQSRPVNFTHEAVTAAQAKREFFIGNLLVRIHLIIEMILEDRPCDMGA